MIQRLMDSYQLDDVTIVADAGMFSSSNKKAIVDAGLSYILETKVRDISYPIAQWHKQHSGQDYTDGQIWTLTDRSGRGLDGVPHSVTYDQYSWDRARRSRKGINEQLAKAWACRRRQNPSQTQPVCGSESSKQEGQPRTG